MARVRRGAGPATSGFNGRMHLEQLARRLIDDFAQARSTRHPGALGAAREDAARRELGKLLSAGIGVGTGFVVDTYGGISLQQDVVIHEAACPTFPLNSNTDISHYPVEGVIAVGEIKSSLDKPKLKAAFKNIASVKSLRRRAVVSQDVEQLPAAVPYRHYQEALSFTPSDEEGYSQFGRDLDQVFGFVLSMAFKTSGSELLSHASDLSRSIPRQFAPNIISSLESGFIAPLRGKTIVDSAMEADGLFHCDEVLSGFSQLVIWLRRYCLEGRTVPAETFDLYFQRSEVFRTGFRRAGYAKTSWLTNSTK